MAAHLLEATSVNLEIHTVALFRLYMSMKIVYKKLLETENFKVNL